MIIFIFVKINKKPSISPIKHQTAYIEYILKCLFGNAEVFISVILHELCSFLLI
jgi:hypothetical protein